MSINIMPDEILLEIFMHLRFTSVGTLAQVCRKWHELAKDEVLWRKMFLEHFSLNISMPPGGAISWRMAFKKKYEESYTLET